MEPTHAHKHHLEVAANRAIAEGMEGCAKHGPFHSFHEAYAVLKEEVDEVWDEIKKRNPDVLSIAREAKQIAGIALRLLAWASRSGEPLSIPKPGDIIRVYRIGEDDESRAVSVIEVKDGKIHFDVGVIELDCDDWEWEVIK